MGREIRRVGDYHKDEVWVEDVMDYFGECIDEEYAKEMLKQCPGGYFEIMNKIRSILLDRGYSVPFRATYRRIKDKKGERDE